MLEFDGLVVTCEHAGNHVPPAYAALFRGNAHLLKSHRGYDPGALDLAKAIARCWKAPLYASSVTRLLVETNRCIEHPNLFSEITRALPREQKTAILARYYVPYRQAVEREIKAAVTDGRRVMHLSVHTFTPVLRLVQRRADIGLLYDPARRDERELCLAWQQTFRVTVPGLRVRRNYPYRGCSDSLVSHLRKRFNSADYCGVELEVNQKHAAGSSRRRDTVRRAILTTLAQVIRIRCG